MPMPSFSRFRRRHTRSRNDEQTSTINHTSTLASFSFHQDHPEQTPIYYIYPGLIRKSSSRAVTIDVHCPASLYGTDHKRVDRLSMLSDAVLAKPCGSTPSSSPCTPSSPSSSSSSCSSACAAPVQGQQDTCSICLEQFCVKRDIIRKLPCSHYFHSKCILTWLLTVDRCPLCNESALRPRSSNQSEVVITEIDVKVEDGEEPKYLTLQSPSSIPSSSSDRQDSTNEDQPPTVMQKRHYSFVLYDHARYCHTRPMDPNTLIHNS